MSSPKFEEWWRSERHMQQQREGSGYYAAPHDAAQSGWNARQPEIDALIAERDAGRASMQAEKEAIVEAAGNLAWAAEVQMHRPQTRSFRIQHESKVRYWIEKVRALLDTEEPKSAS